MDRTELLQIAADLAARGEPFVRAVVVRRESSSSALPGDAALVTAEGEFHGWLGGSCTRPTVIREAREVLADGKPRLLSLTPDPDAEARPGVLARPMACHSGGTVDIFLEPVLPAPRLVVFGQAPVSKALCRLGKAMAYAVDVVEPGADPAAFPGADRIVPALPPPEPGRRRPREILAVVATMGERDEEALAEALPHAPVYLGVIASRKRFAQMREALAARGHPAAALAQVKNPAGLEIGARTPEEIALSVLAEIVKVRRAAKVAAGAAERRAEESAIDPVCGMTVPVAGARHRAEHLGRSYFFCRAGCRERFLADPERYLAGAHAGAVS
ncbi:MAG TPA: XdhC family protein [Anaeromyxobacteraceae bacterium]|nr:XdhC family protein [Anaeromyxobacteraceae bacterium]